MVSRKKVLLSLPIIPGGSGRRTLPKLQEGEGVRDVLLDLTKPLHKLPYVGKRIKVGLQGPRTQLAKRLTNFLDSREGGQQNVMKLEVSQKPIDAEKFLNVISLGKFEATKKKLGYSNVYHRFLIATLRDGSLYVVEKNEIITVRPAKPADLKYPRREIPLPTNRLTTLKELVNNAIFTDNGKVATEESVNRIRYSAGERNCQRFVQELVEDNGLPVSDPETKKMLEPQDSAGLLDAFGALAPLANLITDTAGTLDRVRYGDGVLISTEDENKLSSEYKMKAHDRYHSYALRFSDAQLRRLVEGLAVRLKHDDLSPAEGEGIPVCLTQTQINKVKKSIATGKGMQLTFSKAQLDACADHSVHSGAGIFSDALKRIGKIAVAGYRGVKKLVGNPIARELAKGLATSLGQKYGSTAVDAVAGLAKGAIKSNVPDALAPFVDAGMDLGSRLTKQQLESLLKGIKSGSGLYLPGARPSPPPRG